MKTVVRAVILLGILAELAACGPNHIRPFNPRERKRDIGEYATANEDTKPTDGSIYSEAIAGYLEDTRAARVGDVVFVKIDERADAQGDATTKLSRNSERESSMDAFLGLVPALKKAYPNINPSQLVSLMSKADFAGDGQTSRKGELKGRIAVRVRELLPNGDLFIEGTKVVMINYEEYHLYISGIARPTDIGTDNVIASSYLADAQVEFTGRGDIQDQLKRGWLTKTMDKVRPF